MHVEHHICDSFTWMHSIDHHLCYYGNVVRGYLYKIPEWVSSQSEVRTAFTWQNPTAQPKEFFLAWFSCQIRYACATHPRLLDLQFSNRNKVHFQFTGYQNSFRMTISLGLKTRMKSFWIDLYGNKMSFWYHVHVNKYRDIMEMEWTCSKMKVTLVPCELPVRGGYYRRMKLNYYPFPKRWKIRLKRGGLAL